MRLGPYFEEGGASGPAAVAPAPTPEATPAVPAAPRDPQTGRFAKANIEKAAGGFQDESAQSQLPVVPQVPAAVVPETPAAPVPEVDTVAAIDAYLATQTPAAEPPVAPPAAQPAAAAPAIAPDIQRKVEAHDYLDSALNAGRYEEALSVLAPSARAAIEEHIYQQKKDQWAQRYTDEASGVRKDPEVETLRRQLAAVTEFIQNGHKQTTQAQQQADQQRILTQVASQYQTFVDGLYASAGLKDSPNRAWLEGRVNLELSKDPQLKPLTEAALKGDAKALQLLTGKTGAKFREVYTQFKPLQSAAVPPAPAGQPAGATALMASPAGTSTNQAPANDLVREDGGFSGKGIVRRLKAMVS